MVQSEVRKLWVHSAWFICNEDFIVNAFHKIKLNLLKNLNASFITFLLVYIYVWMISLTGAIILTWLALQQQNKCDFTLKTNSQTEGDSVNVVAKLELSTCPGAMSQSDMVK